MARSIVRGVVRSLAACLLLSAPATAWAAAQVEPRLSFAAEQRFDDELLVEEISIDGMCGVY